MKVAADKAQAQSGNTNQAPTKMLRSVGREK